MWKYTLNGSSAHHGLRSDQIKAMGQIDLTKLCFVRKVKTKETRFLPKA